MALALTLSAGCGHAVIEPGHRGLVFDPKAGLEREILVPGEHHLAGGARVVDFPVIYVGHKEDLSVLTVEGLPVHVQINVVTRPIISELYELDTEIGPRYYDEVVGPEARSAGRAVVAHHELAELSAASVKLEDEIERALRQRVEGRHVEVASVVITDVTLPNEIDQAVRERLAANRPLCPR